MTKISRKPLKKDIEDRMMDVFQKTVAALTNTDDIDSFLDEFLFPVEKVMLAKRLAIAILLIKGYTYPQIVNTLNVSPPTIAAVSLNLKYKSGTYKKLLEKILAGERYKELWDTIGDAAESAIPPRGFNPDYIRDNFESKRRKRKKTF